MDFDLICRLCLGHPLGFIRKHGDLYEFQKTLEERLPIVEKLGVLAEVGMIIKILSYIPLLKRLLPSAKDDRGVGKILGVGLSSATTTLSPRANKGSLRETQWTRRFSKSKATTRIS